jgi:hypothetical protein
VTARRIGALALTGVAAAILAAPAQAALFFLFEPTAAKPAELVSVRLGGTVPGFRPEQRVRPLRPPLRLYLVAADEARGIQSRLDRRLSFVGSIVPDARSRGRLTFTVPPLDTNDYALAYWCPACARYSLGRTFGVQVVPEVSRFRHLMGLRVEMPPASETCPVTKRGYGNGILSTTSPGADGVLVARREPDGTLFQKVWWLPRKGFTGELTVRGERLDAPGQMRVLSVNWGYSSDGRGSWASAIAFPSEGCWRLTGRVRDVSLAYVVKVVSG